MIDVGKGSGKSVFKITVQIYIKDLISFLEMHVKK